MLFQICESRMYSPRVMEQISDFGFRISEFRQASRRRQPPDSLALLNALNSPIKGLILKLRSRVSDFFIGQSATTHKSEIPIPNSEIKFNFTPQPQRTTSGR